MENTVKPEAVVDLKPETMEARAPTRGRLTSAVAAALYFLAHPLTRERVEADAGSGRSRGPKRAPYDPRSTMDAGITGGFSLLMGSQLPRHRR